MNEKQPIDKSIYKNNRKKGHEAERYYANAFKNVGYDKCVTSRYGSRQHDDSGIDLINIPFNVQIKAGTQKGLNFSLELLNIDEKIKQNFLDDAKEKDYINLVIHRKQVKQGMKRNKYHELVCMSFEDFLKIITKNKST